MCVTVSMLASGSRGNCALVASARTRILVDAGYFLPGDVQAPEDR